MTRFFISDTHLNHEAILHFTDKNGEKFRGNKFSSVEEMNEYIIEKWNKTIKPNDKVYHCGDVILGKEEDYLKLLSRLNGKKRLIIGNHDRIINLAPYFEKILYWQKFKSHDFIISHIPLRDEILNKCRFNIHGHIHDKASPTPFHLNISCEQIDYTPIHFDEILAWIKAS